MENKESKIKLYITTAILTFMGTLSFQMSFLNIFMDPVFYNDVIMTFFLLIFALGFAALVVFINKNFQKKVLHLSFPFAIITFARLKKRAET